MLRRAFRILAVGFIVIAAAIYVFEFVFSDYVFPSVSIAQWAILAIAVALIPLLRNRDEVYKHHIPH